MHGRAALLQGLLALVQSFAGDLTFPLTSCLMRHCANAETAHSLTPHQRATVVRLAAQQVRPVSCAGVYASVCECVSVHTRESVRMCYRASVHVCKLLPAIDLQGCPRLETQGAHLM